MPYRALPSGIDEKEVEADLIEKIKIWQGRDITDG